MYRAKTFIPVSLVLLLGLFSLVAGDVPRLIDYQGRLTDASGDPVDTTADLTFTIFADPGGATSLWIETHPSVVIEDGLFSVTLGTYTAFGSTVFNGQKRYLGIQLAGGSMSSPLVAMVSAPYALRSSHSDTASYALAAPGGGSSGWTDDGTTVRLTNINDSVGIGTTNPRAPLEVQGPMHAIIGESHGSGTAAGVLGTNNSDGFGLMGVSTSGRGVTGLSTSGFGGHFYGPKNYFSANLGIGTETPEEMLHIYKNSSGGSSFLKIQSAHVSNWGEAGLRIETPQNQWHLRMDDDDNVQVPSGGLGLRSQSLNNEVMTWTDDGKVGIGITEPTYKLQVSAGADALRAYAASGYVGYFVGPKNYFSGIVGIGTDDPTHKLTVNGELALQKNGVTKFHMNYYNTGFNICETSVADYRFYIKEGGNVGIGTSNPTKKLYVNGNAHVAGTFHADAFETNAIDRDNIVDEVGIASAAVSAWDALGTSWSAYLTREITVPAAGYILAIGCATLDLEHEISGASYAAITFSDVPGGTGGGNIFQLFLNDNVGAGDYTFTQPCQRLFYAPSQGTYTYYMVGIRWADNPAEIGIRHMDLLFVPTPYASKSGELEAIADDVLFSAETDSRHSIDRVRKSKHASERPERAAELSDRAAIREPTSATGEIDQLRTDLAALQQTVAELQARLETGGK